MFVWAFLYSFSAPVYIPFLLTVYSLIVPQTQIGNMDTSSKELGANNKKFTRTDVSEDCGYATQHHESISTSSNEDDG
jgi:hypothetical protein